jgi:hypothetical protein
MATPNRNFFHYNKFIGSIVVFSIDAGTNNHKSWLHVYVCVPVSAPWHKYIIELVLEVSFMSQLFAKNLSMVYFFPLAQDCCQICDGKTTSFI